MPPRRSRAIPHAVYSTLAVFLFAVLTLSPSSGAASSAAAGTAVIRYGNDSWPQTHLPDYGTVFLGPGRTADVDYIRAHSSNSRVLMYKNTTYLTKSCGNPTPASCQTAISYAEALAHDQAYPGDRWLLRNSAGNPIYNRTFTNEFYANVGSASYRQAALDHLLASLRSHAGWNGIFLDECDPGYYNDTGGPIYGSAASPTYPTNASWQTAQKGFLDIAAAGVRRQGFYVAGNTSVVGDSSGSLTASWWSSIANDFDGFMHEFFEMTGSNHVLKYNDPTVYWGNYNQELGKVDAAQNLGKDYFGGMGYYNVDSTTRAAQMMYGKASFLLKWNGNGGGFFWHQSNSDPWSPAWTTDIGAPNGAMYAVGSGWRRNYTGGTVIVNPNKPTGSPITFNLGGNYINPAGQTVTSITLQPVTAMILRSTTTTTTTITNPPVNLTLPTISGTPKQGQTVTANNGTWSNSPTSYSYRWSRCGSGGGSCASISGASAKTYLITAADVGATLRVTVTATNSRGLTAATSAPTAVITAATTTTTTTPPSSVSTSTYYTLVSKNSGKCLDVSGYSTANGGNIQQWSCTGADNQRWRLVAMGDGSYEVVGKQSGKCLDVTALSLLNGANVQQWACGGGKNQRWKLVSTGDGYNQLVAQHSGRCLDVQALSTANGANVQQWACGGGNNQRWLLKIA